MEPKKLKKYPFYLSRRIETEESIETEIEATSWSEARDLLAKQCTTRIISDEQWEAGGTFITGRDYAVHLLATDRPEYEEAMQERKETEARNESIFQDCTWDGDYW